MIAHKLSRTARNIPISPINGGRSANDQVSNRLCLKNGFCAGMMSTTFHVLGVISTDPRFQPNHVLSHHSLNGLRRSLWLVHRVLCGKVDAWHFLRCISVGYTKLPCVWGKANLILKSSASTWQETGATRNCYSIHRRKNISWNESQDAWDFFVKILNPPQTVTASDLVKMKEKKERS